MSVLTCAAARCNGHLGKYADCITEALHMISLDGFADDTTGDVEAYGHHSLIILPTDCSFGWVLVPAGSYVVSEDSNGFVTLTEFNCPESARAGFDIAAYAYARWLDDSGDNG